MRDEQGFTLVEMLVALVAGSLLLASLGWLTGMLGNEVRHTARHGDFEQLADMAPALRLLLGSLRPARGAAKIDVDPSHLAGEVDPPLAWANRGPLPLDLTVARDRDGEGLDLRLGEEGAAGAHQRRLAHGFKSITIDVQQNEPAEPTPKLITISFAGREGGTWDVAVEPRLNSTGGCRFDPISLTCRP